MRIIHLNSRLALAAALSAAALAAGCGSSDDNKSSSGSSTSDTTATTQNASSKRIATNFVGKVEGTDALIAIVVGSKTAVAYVCDSKGIGVRFDGKAGSDHLDLTSKQGDKATVDVNGDDASGTVTLDGKEHKFNANSAPKDAGYYRAQGEVNGQSVTVGWVRAPGGDVKGLVHTEGGLASAAPQLRIDQRTVNVQGQTLQIDHAVNVNEHIHVNP
jgi:serine/threonine protein kinase, bacterial